MNKETKGFIYIIFSGLLFGSMGVLVRYISPFVAPFSQVLIRAIFAIGILSAFILPKTKNLFKVTKKDLLIYALNGVFGYALVLILFTLSVIYTTISNTFFLMYTEPIFVLVLAHFFLNEKINKQLIIALIFSIIGVFFIFNPTNFHTHLLGNLLGLATGFFYGIYIFLGRISGKKYSSSKNTIWTFFFSLLFLVPVTFIFENPFKLTIPINIWLLLLTFGLVNVSAYFCLNSGLNNLKAGYVGILLLFEPASALFYAMIFFKEYPSTTTIIGSTLIVLSIIYLTFSKLNIRKNK